MARWADVEFNRSVTDKAIAIGHTKRVVGGAVKATRKAGGGAGDVGGGVRGGKGDVPPTTNYPLPTGRENRADLSGAPHRGLAQSLRVAWSIFQTRRARDLTPSSTLSCPGWANLHHRWHPARRRSDSTLRLGLRCPRSGFRGERTTVGGERKSTSVRLPRSSVVCMPGAVEMTVAAAVGPVVGVVEDHRPIVGGNEIDPVRLGEAVGREYLFGGA